MTMQNLLGEAEKRVTGLKLVCENEVAATKQQKLALEKLEAEKTALETEKQRIESFQPELESLHSDFLEQANKILIQS